MNDLYDDVLSIIFSKLYDKNTCVLRHNNLQKCKIVCKKWKEIINREHTYKCFINYSLNVCFLHDNFIIKTIKEREHCFIGLEDKYCSYFHAINKDATVDDILNNFKDICYRNDIRFKIGHKCCVGNGRKISVAYFDRKKYSKFINKFLKISLDGYHIYYK